MHAEWLTIDLDFLDFFIHTFKFVFIGKPCTCNVLRPHATWMGVATRTYKRDVLYHMCWKLQYRDPALHEHVGPAGGQGYEPI